MAASHISPEPISQVSELVAAYISEQRERLVSLATNLFSTQKAQLMGFFRPDLLKSTRIVVLQKERTGGGYDGIPLEINAYDLGRPLRDGTSAAVFR